MDNIEAIWDDKAIHWIKRILTAKTVKGKEYYYIRMSFDFRIPGHKRGFTRELYVCPKSTQDKELKYQFCLAERKFMRETYQFLLSASNEYKTLLLKPNEKKELEKIRVAYNVLLKGFGDPDPKRYEESMFTRYVYGTTSIEGNTYTLRETSLILNEGITVGGKDKREFYEIENYGRLKKELPSPNKIKIDLDLVNLIHRIIMAHIDDDSAGEFRRVDVGIRGAEFSPPLSFEVEKKMKGLMKWYAEHEQKMHPVELATIFHQKFTEIHPFVDGNGRVARELVRQIFAMNGYPTIFIDRSSREEYLKSLDEGNKGNYKPLADFFVNNLVNVHHQLLDRAKSSMDSKSDVLDCKKCTVAKKCGR
jgi:Fic family protein